MRELAFRARYLDKSNITLIHRFDNFSKKKKKKTLKGSTKFVKYIISELVGSLKNKYSPNTGFCKCWVGIKKYPQISSDYHLVIPYLKPSEYEVQ